MRKIAAEQRIAERTAPVDCERYAAMCRTRLPVTATDPRAKTSIPKRPLLSTRLSRIAARSAVRPALPAPRDVEHHLADGDLLVAIDVGCVAIVNPGAGAGDPTMVRISATLIDVLVAVADWERDRDAASGVQARRCRSRRPG